jgi:hypothetical protein
VKRAEGITTQCSGLAIKSVLMESPRSRAADRERSKDVSSLMRASKAALPASSQKATVGK